MGRLGVDRKALHRYLWKRSNRRNVVRVQHTELAEELGITKYTMSVIFRQMEDSGKLRKISKAPDGVEYLIYDPDPPQA